MKYNVVIALIKYKSGTYAAQAYAPLELTEGDRAMVEVLSGYTTTCQIHSIIERNTEIGKKRAMISVSNNQEEIIMYGTKLVEVKHVSSARSGIFYTDLDLQVGQTVVYESDNGMHVGVVTNADPDAVSAQTWIVDLVDMTAHKQRIERTKQAKKLKAKLDAKRKQFQDIELLRLIAANDPETKQMLDEYTTLIGGTVK